MDFINRGESATLQLVSESLFAFLVGIVSSMIGVGGGFLIVPILVLVYETSTHLAVGTSAVMIVFTAISSTFAYARQRRIDYKLGLILAVGSIPGAAAGAYATSFVSPKDLASLFGVFLIILAVRMLVAPGEGKKEKRLRMWGWVRRIQDVGGQVFEYEADTVPGMILSFFAGFASGFFGLGGGAVMVPVMVLVMTLPMHIAVATSMFIMIFTSISAATTHIILRNVLADSAVALGIGIVFGTQVGAFTAKRLKARSLQRVFALFLVVIGGRMALQYFS